MPQIAHRGPGLCPPGARAPGRGLKLCRGMDRATIRLGRERPQEQPASGQTGQERVAGTGEADLPGQIGYLADKLVMAGHGVVEQVPGLGRIREVVRVGCPRCRLPSERAPAKSAQRAGQPEALSHPRTRPAAILTRTQNRESARTGTAGALAPPLVIGIDLEHFCRRRRLPRAGGLWHGVAGGRGLRWVAAQSLGPAAGPASGSQPCRVPDDHCRPIHCPRYNPARLHRWARNAAREGGVKSGGCCLSSATGQSRQPGLKPQAAGAILTGRARSDLRLCTWGW